MGQEWGKGVFIYYFSHAFMDAIILVCIGRELVEQTQGEREGILVTPIYNLQKW